MTESSELTNGQVDRDDPLLLYLHENPTFNLQKDTMLFEDLVSRYTVITDNYIQERSFAGSAKQAEPNADFYSLNFDTLSFADQKDHLISHLIQVFENFGLSERFWISSSSMSRFLHKLSEQYRDIPYHNFTHVVDVTQFVSYLLLHGDLSKHLDDFDIMSLLLSTLGHDMGHLGSGVTFEGSLQSPSGLSVEGQTLEECHLKLFFQLLEDKDSGILRNWDKQQSAQLKQLTTAQFAATDLNNHLVALLHFDQFYKDQSQSQRTECSNRRFLTQLAIKCADISNIVRPAPITQKWTKALLSEYGDTSPYNKESVRTKQLTFIDFIGKPLFAALYLTLPRTGDCLWNLHHNRQWWNSSDSLED